MSLAHENGTGTVGDPHQLGLPAMPRQRQRIRANGKTLFSWADLNDPAIVYLARNTGNGNCYVGVTRRTLDQRKLKHLADAKRGQRGRFYNAIRKYGPSAFEFSVLKECASYHEALAEEVSQIELIKPAYNVTRGGEGALGYRHSRETLKLMRTLKLGKPGPWLGKRRSYETIEKIRTTKLANPAVSFWRGKTRSEETKAKISASKRGCAAPPTSPAMQRTRAENMRKAATARRKPVICLADGRIFESAQEASLAYGFHPSSVARVCNPHSRCKAVYGRRFAYIDPGDKR